MCNFYIFDVQMLSKGTEHKTETPAVRDIAGRRPLAYGGAWERRKSVLKKQGKQCTEKNTIFYKKHLKYRKKSCILISAVT